MIFTQWYSKRKRCESTVYNGGMWNGLGKTIIVAMPWIYTHIKYTTLRQSSNLLNKPQKSTHHKHIDIEFAIRENLLHKE